MKYIIPIIASLLLFGCNSQKEKQPETSNTNSSPTIKKESIEIEKATTDINTQIALNFLNSYIDNSNKMKEAIGIIDWVKATPFATENLKHELEKMVNNAWEQNPELGLGFDPIFDAQDYPDEGIELLDFDRETGYLIVKGIKWESFNVTMKVVNQNGQTLVDGCGIINIPEDKRAKR